MRLYDPCANRTVEGVASGYWTRFAKPVSGQSAIAVRLRRPPKATHKRYIDAARKLRDHKAGLANRVLHTGVTQKPRSDDPGLFLDR